MGINASVSGQPQITASVGETKIDVTVSGGVGPTGAQGPAGAAGLPAGTEGYVLTYVSGSWVAAAPASGYTLPTATASVLGGVKIGSGISIDGNGVISASAGYTLPTATGSVLGGVKIGSGVTITDGVISVSTNYAAASHSHSISDVSGLQTALDGKQASGSYAAAVHTHGISDVTGLQTALDGKQASGSYAAATHSHAISDVTNLQATLDGKAASTHSHAISDVTGLQTALDGKQASGSYAAATHTHAASDITSGTIDTARLGSGTASSSTWLRGDGTWSDVRRAVRSDVLSATNYVGVAASGSAASASAWTIYRTIYTSAGAISSRATATNVKWDDRTTASYS